MILKRLSKLYNSPPFPDAYYINEFKCELAAAALGSVAIDLESPEPIMPILLFKVK